MSRINIIPSAAYVLTNKNLRYYTDIDKNPKDGDVMYGEVDNIGQHQSIESKTGRIHKIYSGNKGIFVFGNRYAPDYYEATVPKKRTKKVDLVSRSGMISKMREKNSKIKDPTKIRFLGYVCDKDGNIINTKNYSIINPKRTEKNKPRSKMIVFIGTSMNSGKSFAAAAMVRALTQLNKNVRASKITGTASLKDILSMSDSGAEKYSDFTFVGYPSTYKLNTFELLEIFDKLDLNFANSPKNYWVVEIADGIMQRETAALLLNPEFRKRIHKVVFCAGDALGAIGGAKQLEEVFGIKPNMISGLCTASPLHIKELQEVIHDIPIFNSARANVAEVGREIL
jgi:hypothetical protein